MQIYLVGGAVRDELLNMPIKERDWVVVGCTPQEMLKMGYKQVGKDFPVFLHPKTKEEYALARTERKTGHGYDGFVVHAEASVTLEEDLRRRDLTINAIAKSKDEEIIDFFGGVKDLDSKILRHVSEAFVEDPLRLVRLCRFQARFPNFKIHASTEGLCKEIVSSGEVNHLTPERVWLEWQKVFSAPRPDLFLKTLNRFGAWSILMPGFTQVQQDIACIEKARATLSTDHLFCTLGWYMEYEDRKVHLKNLRLPKDLLQLSLVTHDVFLTWTHDQFKLDAEDLLIKFHKWDVFRRQERFIQACQIVQSVVSTHGQLQRITEMAQQLSLIKPDLQSKQISGQAIAENLRRKRLKKLRDSAQS